MSSEHRSRRHRLLAAAAGSALCLSSFPLARDPAGAAAAPVAGGVPTPGAFNVLLIVLDDTGTEKTGIENLDASYTPMYGELTSAPQPSLDRLTELWGEGIKFNQAYAAPVCSPARAALMTGRWSSWNGVGNLVPQGNCHTNTNAVFKPRSYEVYIPELLALGHSIQSTGVAYSTGLFGKWHLSDRDCDPIERGFDVFQGHTVNNANDFPCGFGISGQRSHFNWRKVTCSASAPGGCTPSLLGCSSECCYTHIDGSSSPDAAHWSASIATDDAIDWISGLGAGTPFFACVGYNPPHVPQQVPPPADYSRRTGGWLNFYGYDPGDSPQDQGGPNETFHRHVVHNAMMEAVDRQIGRFQDELPQAVLDKTIFVVIADNGSDQNQIPPGTINGQPAPPGHGKRSVYQLGVRVPMIVRLPPTFPAQHAFEECDGFVAAVDVWATIANLTGLTSATVADVVAQELTPNDQQTASTSFFQLLIDPSAASARPYAHAETFRRNGGPYITPRLEAVVGLFSHACAPVGHGVHPIKYLRFYDGSADAQLHCVPGNEELYDLACNPLEDPAQNLIGDPGMQTILATLRAQMDTVYVMGDCPQIVFFDKAQPID